METVAEVLDELGLSQRHCFRVFNKVDRVDEPVVERYRERYPGAYFVSAERGDGLTHLKEDIYRYFLKINRVQRPEYAKNLPLERAITA